MKKKTRFIVIGIAGSILLGLIIWYLSRTNIPVLEPAGTVAEEERNLIFFTLILAAIVVIPVFTLTFFIVYRYRANKNPAKYNPSFDHHPLIEFTWWTIPTLIIVILSVVTWRSSHNLDPYKPLVSKSNTMTVQVVSLDWKWLFIYPAAGVASVNELAMPVNTPVHFEITSDSVMNSFWIPQLGGQIYAMPGMETQLYLQATKRGEYYGTPANITGDGFAGMTFKVMSQSNDSFHRWLETLGSAKSQLTEGSYKELSKPSEYNSVVFYSKVNPHLFSGIISKYMTPTTSNSPYMSNIPPAHVQQDMDMGT